MRSQLTRSVFRRLLSKEGLVLHCSTQSALLSRYRYRHRNGSNPPLHFSQRRTLFGFSNKPERRPKEPDLAPGLDKMLALSVVDAINARPPPLDELVRAWNKYFYYKTTKKEAVNQAQAAAALRTFIHMQAISAEGDEGRLNDAQLNTAMSALSIMPKDKTNSHSELARQLYAELGRLRASAKDGARSEAQRAATRHQDLLKLIEILTQTGNALEARDIFLATPSQSVGEDLESKGAAKRNKFIWSWILTGLAKENNETELLSTFRMAETAGVIYEGRVHMIMSTFFARQNDIERTKEWYSRSQIQSGCPLPETVTEILQFCIRTNELDWCKTVFRELLERDPPKLIWDIVLQWAAGAMGKGVEGVERLMDVMVRRYPEDEAMRPDIATINGLIELAMSGKDSYLAERYITLGLKKDIQPNARTYILQMSYRADANDLTGAKAAYDALQAEEVQEDEDLPAINKYIRALCSSKSPTYDRISSILADLEERNKRMEAKTVSALTRMYLERDEMLELQDLLQTQSYHYTLEERAQISQNLLGFIFDRKNNVVRAWETYDLLRNIFDETPTPMRTKLMNEFFTRGRCDMACYIFGHMRQHTITARRPNIETYIECFEGIARCEDDESLDMVHNMLKMDSTIEPNTRLFNSLMLAYTACDRADRAMNFWDDITNSTEGPSYRSLEIVFWACGRKAFGDRKAREIWATMRRMEIEVTGDVASAYVSALAGQGKLEEARDMVLLMEKELDLEVNVSTLATFYNSLPGQNRKDIVEEWAKEKYPEVWAAVEKLGQTTHEEGHRLFNFKWEIRA